MALIHSSDITSSQNFLFSGNNLILKDNKLPDVKLLKRCLDFNAASDWFTDQEFNFSAMELETDCPLPAGCTQISVRSFFWDYRQDPLLIRNAARARGLLNFRKNKRYCERCGGALKDDEQFTAKRCVQCQHQFFPQLEPAVIIIIKNGDKILLAEHKNRNDGMYSCIAGFVESGETLEQAVSREIKEETGLTVKNIRYAGSQSWPFPDQLMLAFYADYESGEIKIQEDELKHAGWFSLDKLPKTPEPGSVAWNLIHGCFTQK